MAVVIWTNFVIFEISFLALIIFETVLCQPYEYKCEPVRVKFCAGLPYNETILPNTLNEDDQNEISIALESQYTPLTNINCSDQLIPLLCFIYVPICTGLDEIIPPCRRLCTQAKSGCESIMNEFKFPWPEVLNCDKFPVSGLCAGENYTSRPNDRITQSNDYSIATKLATPKPPEAVTSKTNVKDPDIDLPVFLMVSTFNNILLFDVPTKDVIILDSGFDQGATIDFHYSKRWIFWAYNSDSRINRGSLTLDVLEDKRMLIDVGPATVTSLAVDWLTDKLFWLESYPSRIRVSDLDGRNPTNVLSRELKEPKSMVIDPFEGCLFWLDWVGDLYSPSATIERFDLRTKRHKVIFNITQDIIKDMGRPIGMTTDLKNKYLYWVDARSESIQRIDYHGKNFQIVLKGGNHISEPHSISIFGKYAFWTDRATQSVVKALKTSGSNVEVLETLTASPPLEIKVFHPHAQPKGMAPYDITLTPSGGAECIHSAHTAYLYWTRFILFFMIGNYVFSFN